VKFIRGLSASDVAFKIGTSGPGSRGIIFGHRGPGKVGHFFNVVRQKDNVRFIDSQTGTGADLSGGFVELWLLQTK